MMVGAFSIIDEKLKSFTKKYYLNRVLKGLFFWFILIFILSLFIFGFEFFLYLSVKIKIIVLLLYLSFFLFSLSYLIILPFFKYLGFFKKISRDQINKIVVSHFPDIKDKLLNIIELNDETETSLFSKDLIISSIDQKINDIHKYKFSDSINLKENIVLVYYFLGTIILAFSISMFSPTFFQDTSFRLLNYQRSFEKPSPYQFMILNKKLNAGKGEDFILNVYVKGKDQVDFLNISLGGKSFLMKKDSTSFFSYKFNNLNNDIVFQFLYNKFKSQYFKIDVLEKPILSNFSIHLEKPSYTLLEDENFDNVTEFLIPEGTKISFKFNSIFTDSIFLCGNDLHFFPIINSQKNTFIYDVICRINENYSVNLNNEFFKLDNYLKLNFKTIKDQYPLISVKKLTDSTDYTKFYFRGSIEDDYGFSNLKFIVKKNEIIDSVFELNISKNIKDQEFIYALDFRNYKNKFKSFNYYFEVKDNDQVNKPKSAISEVFTFVFPDDNEIIENQNKDFDNIQDIISNSMNITDQLKKDLYETEKKLINSELTEWERKEIKKSISAKKNNLEKEIEKLKLKSDEISNYLKSFTDQDQSIIDKQKQIQKLLEDVFSNDLKKLLDEYNKMMQDINKEKLNETKDKLDISLDDLSKQLDKNLELLMKMQIEQQLDLFSQKMDKILKDQQNVEKEFENNSNNIELKKKEEELKDKFSETENLYNEIEELNKKTKEPLNLFDFKQEFDEIKNEFSSTIENLQKSNKKKSKESLKKNSDNLRNLDYKIKQMKDSLFKEQTSENLEDLLQILDNLITYSFNQEEIINSTSNENFNSISFSKQKKLFSDFVIIKDSLYTLAKREPALDNKINNELVKIQYSFIDIEKKFEESQISSVLIDQQKVLTSVNDLSLFLSEIIKQLQKSMSNSMPGNQNCSKPGSNPNPNSMSSSLKNMQKSLQKQLEKVMQMMKDGSSGKAVNNELGKAISQQESMHNILQKMMNQGQVGSGAFETLKQADQLLDKVKDDILRNNVSNSTIERQKQILTRLLEADKSENERDIEEKRKSTTANEQFSSETAKKFENGQTINNFEEKILKNKLILNSYYQVKYQKYINVLDSINGEIYKNSINSK
jgi:hypothetical protein